MDFKGKTILVTGGTGSIGSEIAREVIRRGATARVLSNDENSTYNLMKELGEVHARYLIGDVRDPERVRLAMRGVAGVFHAAAMKHIHISEYNPREAVLTNVLGTQNVLSAAIEQNAFMVNISTDKAVAPTNAMGSSKLLAEKVVAAMGRNLASPLMYSVRFGNVLGSRGSFLHTIMACLKDNQPVPLTDLGMTRFLMTIPQAAKMCVESLDFAKNGDTVILKMPKVKIPDFVAAVCGEGYPTDIVGIREGERLSEQLMTPEEAMHVKEINGYYIINYSTRGKCFPSEWDSACPPYLTVKQIKEMLPP